MKKIFTILSFALAAFSVEAKSVVFTLKNGSLVYYLLGGEANPVMIVNDGKVTVNADAYEITDIKNFYISSEDDPNAIEEVKSIAARFHQNTFVTPAKRAEEVSVFTLDGKMVDVEITLADGFASVSLEKLPQGTYIIHVGKSGFKVAKR